MKKIYLVDVSSLFFRAFYAIRELTSPSGLPVNAIYGFLAMLVKLLNEEKPDYLVFCYDLKDPSFRKDLYTDYKANRTEMPTELALQIPYIKKLADLLGIVSVEQPGLEADDLIGTLAQRSKDWGLQCVIVSGDKDFAQLVNEHVTIFDTMKSVRYDYDGIVKKFGIPPEQFIDYLAIVGDASDNIPGIKGIGEKGAVKLLQEYRSLKSIYENIDQVKPLGLQKKLLESKDNAFLSQKLVTIYNQANLPTDLNFYQRRPIQAEPLRSLMQELNFKTFEKSLFASHVTVEPKESGSTVALSSDAVQDIPVLEVKIEDLDKVFDLQRPVFVFWTESAYFLAQDEQLRVYSQDLLDLGAWADQKGILWKSYDLKFWWHKIQTQKPKGVWDTHIAAYVLFGSDTSDFKKIVQQVLGEVLEDGLFISPRSIYQKHLELESKLMADLKLKDNQQIYSQIDFPLAAVLYKMEKKGFRLDDKVLLAQSQELTQELESLTQQIHFLAKEEFNIASPKQLAVILFQKLGLPSGKKTKTGFSTDNDVLENINHPIAPLILKHREYSKLKSTYLDALPQLQDSQGRVHTDFRQTLTATGRLSSQNPNLQNIPIRTEKGQRIRQAFIAEEGLSLMSADYSQIELRILAHVSEDPGLCRAFADDLDIHAATAAEIYGLSLSDVNESLRRAAKAVNFGIAYGQGAFGLAENLGISRKEAQEIISRYFTKFKKVQDYIQDTIQFAQNNGYVETLTGRRRYIPELKSKNPMVRKFGERAAINAPMQGAASDIVKMAMLKLDQNIPLPMILQVHDELIFEGSLTDLQLHAKEIIQTMEQVIVLKVPLKVNYNIAQNWGDT